MAKPRWVREVHKSRVAKANRLVIQARSRVDDRFDLRNAQVGELCDGALLLALADEIVRVY